MDLLEDIFKQAGLKSRILTNRSFRDSTDLKFPCSKSIGFHVVTQGTAHLSVEGKKEPLVLEKGDLALMARGQDHVVTGKSKLTLVSGAYELWNKPAHPFFDEIPDWFIVKFEDIESFGKLQTIMGVLAEEQSKPGLGSERVVQGLLDILFSFILRKVVEKNSRRPKTWSYAVHDHPIKKAIEILHADRARAWSLEELAQKVGLSRAGFAARFKKALGDTPLHYLAVIRIQKAMELLGKTDKNIENVALEVGYQDPFVFSKAFKRLIGQSPRDFKRAHDGRK